MLKSNIYSANKTFCLVWFLKQINILVTYNTKQVFGGLDILFHEINIDNIIRCKLSRHVFFLC